ncbi:calmodulin-like isoform X2 [Achroia grisella]|uniref:calmodulin-like isoform X2 n=1 Tax=Achroia grisella TaxID=688607 RepID=UPI0027D1F707|nr:calmodulin-like isoform X2 [Achroia grisella]
MALFDVFNPFQGITPRFTEEKINEIIAWFDVHSKPLLVINDGDPLHVITIEKLIDFLKLKKFHRRMFHYPSYAEIMNEAEKLKAGVTRMLTKEQFIYILDKWIVKANLKHELLLAFKIFDTEKRKFLEIDELSFIVTNYGDMFNKAETLELLRDANVQGDGNIFYENFVESLFNVAPELNDITVSGLLIRES